MTQFFYTDPLAASWMAKHFEMRFLSDRTQDGVPADADDHESDTAYEADCGWGKAKDKTYYIHPDSLHLLEPQVGDTVATGEDVFIISPDHHEYRGRSQFRLLTEVQNDFEIIRRNGIAFMWPESEAI